jgi:large subunit ribosomal protein L18e
MGIDLIAGGRRVGHNVRKAPVSQDVYLRLLVKLYRSVKNHLSSLSWIYFLI